MARTSNLANVATVSRASKAWYPGGWDFTSGGAITGDLVEYANNTARDGSSGLLVEEGSTNEIRNPRAEGAVAGTPGTAPTNWGVSAQGTTSSIVGSGYENGWPYVDVRLNGTPSTDPFLVVENVTSGVSVGQDWTLSAGVRVVGGDQTNVNGAYLKIDEKSGGGSTFLGANEQTSQAISGTHVRLHYTATLGDASVDTISAIVRIDWDGSGAIDITLRIYAPQLEQKAYPTSPILPPASSPAASDREADDIELADGAWAGGTDHTLYIEVQEGAAAQSGARTYAALGPTTSSFVQLNENSGGGLTANVRDGGTFIFQPNLGLEGVAGETLRLAIATGASGSAISANTGDPQITDGDAQTADIGGPLLIGSSLSGAEQPNAYIKQIRYWPRRLTNDELEALVGN